MAVSPVIFLLVKGTFNSQLKAVSNDKTSQIFTIQKGESLNNLAEQLKKRNLIKNKLTFIIFAKLTSQAGKIQAGTFRLSPNLSVSEVLQAITGQPLALWVTLIEGLRVEEMAEQLSSKFNLPVSRTGFQSAKFMKLAKEGYMFPDTYLFEPDVTEEQIVQKLTDNFDQKYSEDLKSKIKASGLSTEEGIILASIVEREARTEEARTGVANILLKRYKIGMGLNADATIQYALGYQPLEKSWWKRHLTKEDLKINSPYNTYIHSGLPPSPICNPGLISLKAVANADSNTPYLYYYHDSKGRSFYAKTLEEHNQNVANNP